MVCWVVTETTGPITRHGGQGMRVPREVREGWKRQLLQGGVAAGAWRGAAYRQMRVTSEHQARCCHAATSSHLQAEGEHLAVACQCLLCQALYALAVQVLGLAGLGHVAHLRGRVGR